MEAQAKAGIELYGSVMRYAEVEQYGNRYRLLRLGSCDFEFDVAHEVLYAEEPGHLETVAEAIGDVFAGSIATHIHVAVHPPGGYTFLSPIASDATPVARQDQLRREATLLVEDDTLHLTTDLLRTETDGAGEAVDWHHVLALSTLVHARFEHILRVLPRTHFRPMVSMQGAAETIDRLETRLPALPQTPFTLALGTYPTHVEFVICEGGRWHCGHHTEPGTPADHAYTALALFRQYGLPADAVGRIFLYGSRPEVERFADLEAVFGVAPERLNPIPIVDLDPHSLADDFDVEAYVPCVGVAL